MKSLIYLLIGLTVLTSGCNDNQVVDPFSEEEQLQKDLDLIDTWLADNGVTDVLIHSSGIRYTINDLGEDGTRAEPANILTVQYEGRFLDTGDVFDSNNSFRFVLKPMDIIDGWYFMLQEMNVGNSFTIYLPSALAYGRSGNRGIPPNTVLVFDIKLLRVE